MSCGETHPIAIVWTGEVAGWESGDSVAKDIFYSSADQFVPFNSSAQHAASSLSRVQVSSPNVTPSPVSSSSSSACGSSSGSWESPRDEDDVNCGKNPIVDQSQLATSVLEADSEKPQVDAGGLAPPDEN
ncbi:unnamed protein product [Phytophthora fragariaefolia]|uniref:Unnamed protein product n=1 Tax=Phytophthora fragariaefolia TaxID=1490495 RepID=A0A9W6XS49_9STRA|nr:unnamed protein product [Phytophthora fragariaefolia]